VDFVFDVVKPSDREWWVKCVPEAIRQKAEQRQKDERNKFPREAYLDLLDLKKIIAKNWRLFEPHFAVVTASRGKGESLRFFDGLNEIRRLIGHPLKMHVSGYNFSEEQRKLLAHVDDLALKLIRRVRSLN